MWYVYVLRNQNKKLYIGYSADLKSRFANHAKGTVRATRHARPWTLIYYEAYQSELPARTREVKLKQRGRAWQELKKRIGIVPKVVLGHGVPIEE